VVVVCFGWVVVVCFGCVVVVVVGAGRVVEVMGGTVAAKMEVVVAALVVVVVVADVVVAGVVVVTAASAFAFSFLSRATTASAALRDDSLIPTCKVAMLEGNRSLRFTGLVSMSCGLNQSSPPGRPS
jgi:hypothetical protein